MAQVSMGGFRNTRKVHDWEGFMLELDETLYDFGTTWEIEVETSEPEVSPSPSVRSRPMLRVRGDLTKELPYMIILNVFSYLLYQ